MRRAPELTLALVEEQERELEEAEEALARIAAKHERVLATTAADLAQGVASQPRRRAARTGPSEPADSIATSYRSLSATASRSSTATSSARGTSLGIE